jgi:predicted transcriptional regulator
MKHDNDISAWNHRAYESMINQLQDVYRFWHGKWITQLHIAVHFDVTKATAGRWLNMLADSGMMERTRDGHYKYRAIQPIEADIDDFI